MVSELAAHLVSNIVELILYGIFFALSTVSLGLLLRRHREKFSETSTCHGWMRIPAFVWVRVRNSPLIVATIFLMVTVTAHCATSAHRLILAFVHHDGQQQQIEFLGLLDERTQVINLVLALVDMFIGDLVLTYRVWVVWERHIRIIVLPILTIVALLATGITMVYKFMASNTSGTVFEPSVTRLLTAYGIMTVVTNIYGTVVIAYRIWATNRLLKGTGVYIGGRTVGLLETMAIFVESAALYTAWGVFYLVVNGTKSTLEYVGAGCAPTILGITFMLITVRVGLGWAQESREFADDFTWGRPSQSRSARTVIPALSFSNGPYATEDQSRISLAPPKKALTLPEHIEECGVGG